MPKCSPKNNLKEKGITIYLSIVIMSIMIAIIMSVSIFLVNQLRMVKGMESSISAFYAADSGIEEALKVIIKDGEAGLQHSYSAIVGSGGASYIAEVSCCVKSGANAVCNFLIDTDCPIGSGEVDANCLATRYCVRSIGTIDGVSRAIEISY